MKEQWRTDKDAATVEEGLQQEKQEYVSKLKYKTNCCKQWIRYIRLIFLFELLLFLGWGCYMILQSYHFRVTENGVTDINNEKYSPVFESVFEAQKSLPTTEMPVIFTKPVAITNKLNNLLRAIKIRNANEHGKTIVIDLDSIMQTSTQNSISTSNNIAKTNDHSAINQSPMTSAENSVYDDGFVKILVSKMSSREYFDKMFTTNKNENPHNYYKSDFYKLFENLPNIINSIINGELKDFENEDLNEDVNQFTLNNQEDRVLDTSNKVESLGPDVTTIFNLKDSDFKINFESSEQDPEQRFSNLFEDAADDHGEKSSSRDGTGEEINASESGFVICPPYQSYETSGIFSEDAIKSSSTSQSVSAPEILGQIKNALSDYSIKNNDKQDADDNNMPTSTLSDASVFESDEHSAFDTPKPIIFQYKEAYDLSKINNYGKEGEEITIKEKEESSSTSQSVSAPEILGQIKNALSDYSIKNNDKQDEDDNNMPTSTSSDASVFESDEHSAFDTPKPFIFQYKEAYDLSKINNYGKEEGEITIKEEERNDEEEQWENIDPFVSFLLQKFQDTDVESSTPNAFQWFNAPPSFANDLPLGPKDISESMSTPNPSLEDTTEATTENTEAINVFISEKDKSHNQCRIEVKMNVITIKCPDMLDAEWNLASSQPNTHDADFSNVNFKDNFDFYMDDYNDDYVSELHHRIPTVINTDELQKSIPDAKSLKDASDFIFVINPFDKTEVDKHDIIDSSEKEKISSMQQEKQLKSAEDFLNFDNTETFLENKERVYALERQLTSTFNDEMLNIIKQSLPESSEGDYSDYLCSISIYLCPLFPNLSRQQYVNLKRLLNYAHNQDNPYDIKDNYNNRKKRTVDDLPILEQYEPVSNTLEEFDKNLSRNLKKVFQKMEILAACIDKLHERILNNKLDDDYVSKESSMETEERQELYKKVDI